jgi:hypothetical protein
MVYNVNMLFLMDACLNFETLFSKGIPLNQMVLFNIFVWAVINRFCGLVVRVIGYRSRGSGPIPGGIRFSENE